MKYSVLVVVFCLSFLPFYGQTGLRFDGEDDYVNLNSLSTLMDTLDVFTIDFWVKFDSNENTDYGVFFSSNSASNENIFLIRVGNGGFDPVNGSAVVYINDSGNNYISGTSNIGDNECHHIAFSYFNNVCSLYVDGILEASANHTIQFSSTDQFSFGQEYDGGFNSESNFYNGSLDEFRIWNDFKDSNEIVDLMTYNPVLTEPFLVSQFSFEEGLASGVNSSLTHCVNQVDTSMNGVLQNFDLIGSLSNYIQENCNTEIEITYLDTTVCFAPFISHSGNEYLESGSFSDSVFSGNGLVSIQNIDLEISMENVDLDIHVLSTGELVSYDTLASFQWLYCENFSPVIGEVSSNYSPTNPGFYALELTYMGCKDTTACVLTKGFGLEEDVFGFKVFPNPSTGDFIIDASGLVGDFSYKIISSVGKVVEKNTIKVFPIQINIQQEGYFVIELFESKSKCLAHYPIVIY